MTTTRKKTGVLSRTDDRIIIHFDYDAFYASVIEAENPALRSLPFAVQQKQIIVTCNYEARRRGLRKLQLITEARKVCPDVVIVLGEQLDRFRDASKMLYKYLEAFTWNKKVERLGFDEVFMDVSDIVSYNQALLNVHDLGNSFFQLSRDDPTSGFSFDANVVSGHEYPQSHTEGALDLSDDEVRLRTRLILGSHLARHIRHKLEEDKGYTSTVGISTSKLISKLVGNLHKPKGQTSMMPPYEVSSTSDRNAVSNITSFMDSHDIGKVPGIGFKMSHKIRCHVLSRAAKFDEGLVYGPTKESVSVRDVRLYPNMTAEVMEKILGGPGAEKGIGTRAFALIHGVDETEVKKARQVPSQISIEDSYIRLDSLPQIKKEIRMLSTTLIKRMHIDLLEDDEDDGSGQKKRWIAHPRTIRLSTRPRPPPNSDGTRTRTFSRISRSGPLPSFIFDLREGVDALVERLAQETLMPMFHRLHPEDHGWNLSLMNIGVTNMAETATNDGSGDGRDIGRMFKRQDTVLKGWKVEDRDVPPEEIQVEAERQAAKVASHAESTATHVIPTPARVEPSAGCETRPDLEIMGSEEVLVPSQGSIDEEAGWIDDEDELGGRCGVCGAVMPAFAMAAHERFHNSAV